MTCRARMQNANDSKSLWNYTLSPGWSPFDAHILRLAIMRHGCGSWRNIAKYFPLKNCNQLNLQTQRLFGQQALAEFQKVHIDPSRIKEINDKKEGFRKNNCLINTGNNLRLEERVKRRNAHIAKFGIPQELYDQLTIPVVLDPPKRCTTLVDKIEKLRELYRCVYDIQLRLKQLRENGGDNRANIELKKRIAARKAPDAKEPEATAKKEDVEMAKDQNNNSKTTADVVTKPPVNMDDDMAIAMALSASMEAANINTPAPEKKKKSKRKQSTKRKSSKKQSAKKRGSRKRKKMDEDDEDYNPQPAKKRVKRK